MRRMVAVAAAGGACSWVTDDVDATGGGAREFEVYTGEGWSRDSKTVTTWFSNPMTWTVMACLSAVAPAAGHDEMNWPHSDIVEVGHTHETKAPRDPKFSLKRLDLSS